MDFLKTLGIEGTNLGTSTGQKFLGDSDGEKISSHTPIDGSKIGDTTVTTREEYDQVVVKAQEAFKEWRMVPAPERGEIVRQIGLELREHKDDLGRLVTYEMGKIYEEGLGEVQEMIDICDFAVGQSRMLYGKTMQSERPRHRMYEQWQPLGITGIISAFNFPVAVYSWNAMIAAICGNVMIWKGSEKTPLCGIAVQNIIAKVLKRNDMPEGIFNLVTGGRDVGEWMAEDERLPLISATGSIRMGKEVAKTVGARLGKTILELGGNNAIIVTENADLEMAARATVFGKYSDLDEAIAKHNGVKQGLSSSMFTLNMREAETFLSARGSDCGIANINVGTSGAEIGGAFGGEKETGGGRESGSDAWKAYMRRQTNTINWSNEMPLAQGIEFDVE